MYIRVNSLKIACMDKVSNVVAIDILVLEP